MKNERINQSEIARRLGCARKSVSKHLLKAGAPDPDAAGLFDFSEVSQFIQAERKSDKRNSPAELTEARLQKLQAEIALLNQKLDTSGNMIPLERIAPFIGEFLNETRYKFQEQKNVLPPVIAGHSYDAPAIWNIINNWQTGALEDLAKWILNKGLVINDKTIDLSEPAKELAWWIKYEKKEIIPDVESERQFGLRIETAKYALLALPNALATKLEGKNAGEIEKTIKQAIFDCLQHLSGKQKT